jgi:hypothetical protein
MVKYWTTFDEGGCRTATYLEGIHGAENIPADAFPLNEEEWQLYCTGKYKRNMETGEPEEIAPEPQPGPIPPSTEDRLAAAEAAILAVMEVIG